MDMKQFWNTSFILALLLVSAGCARKEQPVTVQHTFTVDTLLPHQPLLNQARTSTCWSFASASLVEADLLALGDSVRLSPMYVARQKYLDHFDACYYSRGRETVRGGSLGHTFLRVWREHGLMPLEAYPGKPSEAEPHDHRKLVKQLNSLAQEALKSHDLAGGRLKAERLLDEVMGVVPDTFLYRGTAYTPRTFADALPVTPEAYVQLTSFAHHPYYRPFILEVPDNWEHGQFHNLPLDELEEVVQTALLVEGQTVAWDGDISEPAYKSGCGVLFWTDVPVTQESRQRGFEDFTTTDDHLMHLVGMAHDEEGTPYYIVKNSYGKRGPYEGYLYMSRDYFRAKTVSVMLRKGE